jgi:hypothetical protein
MKPQTGWADGLGAGPIPGPNLLAIEREPLGSSPPSIVTLPHDWHARPAEEDPVAFHEFEPDNEINAEQAMHTNGLCAVILTFLNVSDTERLWIDIAGVAFVIVVFPVITIEDSPEHEF